MEKPGHVRNHIQPWFVGNEGNIILLPCFKWIVHYDEALENDGWIDLLLHGVGCMCGCMFAVVLEAVVAVSVGGYFLRCRFQNLAKFEVLS